MTFSTLTFQPSDLFLPTGHTVMTIAHLKAEIGGEGHMSLVMAILSLTLIEGSLFSTFKQHTRAAGEQLSAGESVTEPFT